MLGFNIRALFMRTHEFSLHIHASCFIMTQLHFFYG